VTLTSLASRSHNQEGSTEQFSPSQNFQKHFQLLGTAAGYNQGRRNVGREGGGAEKKLRAMETYKNQNHCQLPSSTVLNEFRGDWVLRAFSG